MDSFVTTDFLGNNGASLLKTLIKPFEKLRVAQGIHPFNSYITEG